MKKGRRWTFDTMRTDKGQEISKAQIKTLNRMRMNTEKYKTKQGKQRQCLEQTNSP
jgi:hypothetical protein